MDYGSNVNTGNLQSIKLMMGVRLYYNRAYLRCHKLREICERFGLEFKEEEVLSYNTSIIYRQEEKSSFGREMYRTRCGPYYLGTP